jgi:hypothetical protein
MYFMSGYYNAAASKWSPGIRWAAVLARAWPISSSDNESQSATFSKSRRNFILPGSIEPQAMGSASVQ